MKNVIEIQHLSKSFGDIKAVQDLSFRVKEGELFAFLGINGAGKSTTISILCGQLPKDGGTVTIDGADLDRNIISGRLSLSGTNAGLPCGFSTRSFKICANFFFPSSFSMAVMPKSFGS